MSTAVPIGQLPSSDEGAEVAVLAEQLPISDVWDRPGGRANGGMCCVRSADAQSIASRCAPRPSVASGAGGACGAAI